MSALHVLRDGSRVETKSVWETDMPSTTDHVETNASTLASLVQRNVQQTRPQQLSSAPPEQRETE